MGIHSRKVMPLVALICLAMPSALSAHGLHGTAAGATHGAIHALELVAVVVAAAGAGWALFRRVGRTPPR
jgi:transcriptional regulator of acetoin/glycerol metabolism